MDEIFSNGVQKLYNCVSRGLGTFMIPREVRSIIDKEAEQIEMIDSDGGIVEEAIELYHDKKQPIEEVKALYGRTCSRMLYQEMRKQQNIENVVAKAKENLVEESQVSEEEVSEDWLLRFFNSVQDISDEDMQRLWGKILAGEIKKPNTFSLRSLDVLSKMTKREAQIFVELRPYIISYRGTWAILNDDELNKRYHISYEKILTMSECGLMDSSGIMSITLTIAPKYPLELVYDMEFFKSNNVEEKKISIPIYKLTQTGIDILNVVDEKYNKNYFHDITRHLAKKNKEIPFSLHQIVQKNSDGSFRYSTSQITISEQ